MTLLVELLAHNKGSDLGDLVDDIVICGIDGPHLFGFFRIESVALGEHAEDGVGLVHLFTVLLPHWDLTVRHGSFHSAPLFESDPLVLEFNLSVSQEHSDWFSTTIDTEISKFSHKIF